MRDKPQLRVTRDYAMFEGHEFNRPLHENDDLMESMRKYGFMSSSPLQVVRVGGKLKIIRGHHRFDCAKRLGLQVWYVIDDSNTDIFALEGRSQTWSINDFVHARARAGDPHCAAIIEFQQAHGLTLGAAVSLIGGESPGSDNKIRGVKTGLFRATTDMSHASVVVRITDYCRAAGIKFATSSAFVAAVSRVVRVPDFDANVLLRRVSANPGLMAKRGTISEYLDEIETLYNYGGKGKRLPLAFTAKTISAQRKVNFGR